MMQSSEIGGRFSGYGFSVLSGVLLGISFPSYPFIRLELIAWISLVPLLVSLREDLGFRSFIARVYSTMLVFCAISLWWVSLATLPGGLLTVFAQALFSTTPLLLFFWVKKWRGYRFALFTLPFLWVSWEWLYISQELSLGWLVLGNSQALLNPMIQYADIFGVWGVSFWLVCFNVVAADLWLRFHEHKKLSVHGAVLLALVLLPLVYASMVFADPELQEERPEVTVSLIQPNIDPFEKWNRYTSQDIMLIYFSMTDSAVSQQRADLILWPETAIPFYILDQRNRGYFDLLRSRVKQWGGALVSGYSDIVYYSDADVSGSGYLYKYDPEAERHYQTFNASMLVGTGERKPQVYRKMKLVPFAERVPYMEYAPWLDNLTLSLAGISSWGKGSDMTVMEFTTVSGESVKLSNVICYESIFPGLVAGFVNKGAEFLTLVTNDGWYDKSYGPYQHAAIARIRCIENRRSMARCANTGLSQFIDKYGRVYASIPWWERLSLTADVERNEIRTLYTRYPDMLPRATTALSALLLLFVFLVRAKR